MVSRFILIQLMLLTHLSHGFVKLYAVGNRIHFTSKVDYINVSYIFYQPESLVNQSIDMRVQFKRPLRGIKLALSYFFIANNATAPRLVAKRTVDVCFFFRHPESDRLIKLVFDYIKQHSTIPMRCPIPPGSYNTLIRLSDVPVPAFLPETDFMWDTTYSSEVRQETLAVFRLYGSLVRVFNNIFTPGD